MFQIIDFKNLHTHFVYMRNWLWKL